MSGCKTIVPAGRYPLQAGESGLTFPYPAQSCPCTHAMEIEKQGNMSIRGKRFCQGRQGNGDHGHKYWYP